MSFLGSWRFDSSQAHKQASIRDMAPMRGLLPVAGMVLQVAAHVTDEVRSNTGRACEDGVR